VAAILGNFRLNRENILSRVDPVYNGLLLRIFADDIFVENANVRLSGVTIKPMIKASK
jgi:hypothetical protein